MKEWHRKKFYKYNPLVTAIKSNGWSAHLFAVEVGTRGYCATSVKSCLLRLGLPGKMVRPILKSLSLTSLKASFQIWQARDVK